MGVDVVGAAAAAKVLLSGAKLGKSEDLYPLKKNKVPHHSNPCSLLTTCYPPPSPAPSHLDHIPILHHHNHAGPKPHCEHENPLMLHTVNPHSAVTGVEVPNISRNVPKFDSNCQKRTTTAPLSCIPFGIHFHLTPLIRFNIQDSNPARWGVLGLAPCALQMDDGHFSENLSERR